MSKPSVDLLADRGVLRISGADAIPFLNGIVSNDVAKLADAEAGSAMFAGLLTPQGKILFDFICVRTSDGLVIDCWREQAAELAKKLSFYKLRAAVTVEDRSAALAVVVAAGGDAEATAAVKTLPGAMTYRDPRHSELGHRAIVACDVASQSAPTSQGDAPDAYDDLRIGLGVPEIGKDYAPATTYPHEADYDLFNGVSFRKGCYVGQEVVSRMHHKAVVRHRFVRVSGTDALMKDSDITAGSAAIGRVSSVAGREALALVRLDRAAEALERGDIVVANGTPVTIDPEAMTRYRAAAATKAQPSA